MTLIQAQQRYIETAKANPWKKNVLAGAKLELCRWAKRNGYDPVIVLHDAFDMLDLELAAEGV